MIKPEIIQAAADLYMDKAVSMKQKRTQLDLLVAQLNPKE